MQDATAQMALLIYDGKKAVAVPSTVHADHLIRFQNNSSEDLKGLDINSEVYDFLSSVCSKYGIDFEARCRNYSSSNFRELCRRYDD